MPSRLTVIGLFLLFLFPSASWADNLSVSKNGDLAFASFVILSSGGTVTVSAAGARSSSGGVMLMKGGMVAAASFTMTGTSNSSYNINLPSNDTVFLTSGGHFLSLTNFTCSVPLTGRLGGGRTSMNFTVGATATTTPFAAPGTYRGTGWVSVSN